MIIAIDFDGTIVEHKYPEIGAILPYAKTVIELLHLQGHKIIIWTCRNGKSLFEMKDWLDENRIPYDYINEPLPFEETGFNSYPKVLADIYIDDRNFGGFPGWDVIGESLLRVA